MYAGWQVNLIRYMGDFNDFEIGFSVFRVSCRDLETDIPSLPET